MKLGQTVFYTIMNRYTDFETAVKMDGRLISIGILFITVGMVLIYSG